MEIAAWIGLGVSAYLLVGTLVTTHWWLRHGDKLLRGIAADSRFHSEEVWAICAALVLLVLTMIVAWPWERKRQPL